MIQFVKLMIISPYKSCDFAYTFSYKIVISKGERIKEFTRIPYSLTSLCTSSLTALS